MKILGIFIVAIFALSACGDKPKEQAKAPTAVLEPELHTELYGTYIGNFEDGTPEDQQDDYLEPIKISLSIKHITAKGADARSIVRGNDRPMSGQITKAGDKYNFVMDEPGDDKHDGRFTFTIVGDSLIGTWTAFDVNMKFPKKKFVLYKKPFQYSANLMLPKDWEYVDWENKKNTSELYTNDDGTIDTFVNEVYRSASNKVYTLNASAKPLTEKEVKNLRKLDLEILRNTVFARHGYAFKKKSVRQFFDQVEWYAPVNSNVDGEITALEKTNIDLLKRFEKYAEDNYDSFGR